MANKSLFLMFLGFIAVALPTDSYSIVRGGRGGRVNRDVGDRNIGRDRGFDDDRRRAAYYGAGMYGVYGATDYYIPAPEAESYNDITNPQPGDQSSSTNFQQSNFDSQIWDLRN